MLNKHDISLNPVAIQERWLFMPTQIVTRFAPSPTGFLHIGGARTALFNWLYAKANGGKMLLRIEDTDRKRSSQQAIDAILAGLDWLGLDFDGEPVFQFARAERHREVAEQMITQGTAYKCYCSPEELQEMREKARAQGRPQVYDGTWRERDPAEAPSGIDPVIRFKSPQDGQTNIDDQVQGKVSVPNETLDDLILLRSNGTPTYMLSVVVDDHDMNISHVIRGDDHLTNAARQSQIYEALGWNIPVFAHIPLIHGADGAKLSKRHGALGVEAYEEMGYLPDAMRNYLARLGWSHGDDEIISTAQLIEWFDLGDINKGAARFDFAKLENLNGHYFRARADETLVGELLSFIKRFDNSVYKAIDDIKAIEKQLLMAMPGLKERAKTMRELTVSAGFLFAKRPLTLDDQALKMLDSDARIVLHDILPVLEALNDWRAEAVEITIKDFVKKQDLKLGKLAQPLRAALTGTAKSPGIFDVIAVLGQDETLLRIRDQAQLET